MVLEQALLGLWKPLWSPMGVWVALCLPNHFRHVIRNSSVEVVSFLAWWESETMVCPQRREGSWYWEELRNIFCLAFFPRSWIAALRQEILNFQQKEKESIGAS
jgi:hypothetical protein